MNSGAGGVSLSLAASQEMVVALDSTHHVHLQLPPGLPQLVPGAGGGHVVQAASGQSPVQETRGVTIGQQGHRVGLLQAPELGVCSNIRIGSGSVATFSNAQLK